MAQLDSALSINSDERSD